jgi:hypothetical protein
VKAERFLARERRIHSGASASQMPNAQPERPGEEVKAERFLARERRIHSGASASQTPNAQPERPGERVKAQPEQPRK